LFVKYQYTNCTYV